MWGCLRRVDRGWLTVGVLTLAWCLVVGRLAIRQHLAFNTSYDLAVFTQVVWATASGQPFYSSLVGPTSQLLGYHFSPLLAALVPLYSLWPEARCLLVAQTLALAAGTFPLFAFARRRLGPRLALALVAAYLLCPALHTVALFDFHEIALSVPLLMAAGTALLDRRPRAAALWLALSALILWRAAVLLHERDRARLPRQSLGLGLLLGLGILSKVSVGGLVPVAGLAIGLACLRAGEGARSEASPNGPPMGLLSAARCLALAGAAVVAVAGWYFLRNWLVHGDPLGWSFVLKVNALREGPLTAEVLRWLAVGIFRSYWLGWIGIVFDEPIYWALAGACLAGAAGFAAWLIRRWRHLAAATRWTLALLGLSTAITLGSLVQWTATVLGTDQGRLIYPALPALMLVLAAGWAWWGRGAGRAWLLGVPCAGMLFLAVLTPIRIIAPVHAPAPVATEAELAAARPLGVTWGERVRLLGYRLETGSVAPGEKLILHLYWQGIAPTEPDWMALIRLAGPDGTELVKADGSPTAGRDTTDRWTPGVPLASRHLLPVPGYGQPGEYRLTISLHPFGEGAWIPAIGPDGALIGDRLVLPVTIRVEK